MEARLPGATLRPEEWEQLRTAPCSVCGSAGDAERGPQNVGTKDWRLGVVSHNVFPLCRGCWAVRAGMSPQALRDRARGMHRWLSDPEARKARLATLCPPRKDHELRRSARREAAKCGAEPSSLSLLRGVSARPCYYCGTDGPSGADRVDSYACPSYAAGNMVPCCYLCNRMKHVLPRLVFLQQIRRIALAAH